MKWQGGVTLVEAMVSTLLLAILFLGLAFVLSRAFVSQRYVNTQSLALLEIRNNLQTVGLGINDICVVGASPGSVSIAGTSITVGNNGCTEVPVDVEISGFSSYPLTIHSITLTADSTELFGGTLVFSSQ